MHSLINFSGFVILLLCLLKVGAIEDGSVVEFCAERDDLTIDSTVIEINGVSCNSEDFRLFQNQSEILGLNVSHSDFVLEFDKLKLERLNEIHACGNQIKTLDAINDQTFPNLSVMNFSDNLIHQIRRDLFKHTKFLLELDLSLNCLTVFPFKELLESSDLKLLVLNLQGNFIATLGEAPLIENVVSLSKLDLSHNHLHDFTTTNLHVNNLILRHNQLRVIQINADVAFNTSVKFGCDATHNQVERFESKFEFKIIDLSDNLVKRLQNISVSGVEILKLSNNLISEVNDEDLKVFSNYDKFVTPQGFKKFRDLSELDLSGNKISSIDYENFKSKFPAIERLIINRNNFPRSFLKNLFTYSHSENCEFEIISDDPPPSSHLQIWGYSILISLIITIIIMLIIVKRKNLQKLKYSGFFITFTDRERLSNEDF